MDQFLSQETAPDAWLDWILMKEGLSDQLYTTGQDTAKARFILFFIIYILEHFTGSKVKYQH